MKNFFLLLALSLVLFLPIGNGQDTASNKPVRALNNYVNFINESIHGMLIAHRLLENYNQEINKFVDLDSYEINKFSNKDLPSNIFEDPEHWFYSKSPYDLYKIAKQTSVNLPVVISKSLNEKMDLLKSDIDGINRIRFTIPTFIEQNDLKNHEKVDEVYKLLEDAVVLFDHFFIVQKEMEKILLKANNQYGNSIDELKSVLSVMDNIWLDTKKILRSVRAKEDENLNQEISKLENDYTVLKAISLSGHPVSNMNSSKVVRSWDMMKSKVEALIANANKLIQTGEVPDEYKLYGKFYYYHNALLTTSLNRYGFGMAHEMNKIIKELDINTLYRIEEPHYYRVIYPEKLKVEEGVIQSSDDNIVQAPEELKNRKIIKSTRYIEIDTSIFDISLYDHKIQDGDIVSINFNGDWILENHSLEGAKTTLKLKLNKEGKNYLLLHAVNEGRNPPNTMAIEYFYKGERKKINLSSNLAESEMIEIKYNGQ